VEVRKSSSSLIAIPQSRTPSSLTESGRSKGRYDRPDGWASPHAPPQGAHPRSAGSSSCGRIPPAPLRATILGSCAMIAPSGRRGWYATRTTVLTRRRRRSPLSSTRGAIWTRVRRECFMYAVIRNYQNEAPDILDQIQTLRMPSKMSSEVSKVSRPTTCSTRGTVVSQPSAYSRTGLARRSPRGPQPSGLRRTSQTGHPIRRRSFRATWRYR
jgi:hypothetical protein